MDVAGCSLQEGRDPDRPAPAGEPALGSVRLRVVGHPAHEGAAAVEALAGVSRPDGALPLIEPGGGGAESVAVVRRHDLAWRTVDARAVEQRVVGRLVLERDPLRPAPTDHGPAAEGRDRLEGRREHQGIALRVEPVERLRHRRGGIGGDPLELAELVHGVGGSDVQVDRLGIFGVGQVARPARGAHDEDPSGAQRAQLVDPPGGGGDGHARQDDRPTPDPVADGPADPFRDFVRQNQSSPRRMRRAWVRRTSLDRVSRSAKTARSSSE